MQFCKCIFLSFWMIKLFIIILNKKEKWISEKPNFSWLISGLLKAELCKLCKSLILFKINTDLTKCTRCELCRLWQLQKIMSVLMSCSLSLFFWFSPDYCFLGEGIWRNLKTGSVAHHYLAAHKENHTRGRKWPSLTTLFFPTNFPVIFIPWASFCFPLFSLKHCHEFLL